MSSKMKKECRERKRSEGEIAEQRRKIEGKKGTWEDEEVGVAKDIFKTIKRSCHIIQNYKRINIFCHINFLVIIWLGLLTILLR